jgi:hypothetical protein
MIVKYSKMIIAVACVFIFALSLTMSLANSVYACQQCCWKTCGNSSDQYKTAKWEGGICVPVSPSHCCYYVPPNCYTPQ